MKPTCLDGYELNEKICICEKKTSPKKQTLKNKTNKKKCTLRNPPADEDGYCNEKQPYYLDGCCYSGEKDTKGNVREFKVRGTTLSKKTPKVKKTKKSTKLIIKNKTPVKDLILSNEVKKDINNSNRTIVKSFSPEVNKLIKSINEDKTKYSVMKNYFTPKIKELNESKKGTGPSDDVRYDMMDDEFLKLLEDPFVIDKNGKKHKYTSKKAVELLVNNLNKKVNCDQVIAPIQWHSNCWFNSGFMIYFISDKGRKFNRYLREAMITGSIVKTYNKDVPLKSGERLDSNKGIIRKTIKPLNLRKVFFIFNLCIEASLSGNQMAYFMDTNFIVRNLYDILNKKNVDIVKTNKPSNPETFYESIKKYLFDMKTSYQTSYIGSSPNDIPVHEMHFYISDNYDLDYLAEIINTRIRANAHNSAPDMIGLAIGDNNDGTAGPSGSINKKKTTFQISYNDKKITYALDSVLIRDTSTRHFCCLITCNGNDMGFDGESFHRVSPFKWKNLINKDKDWRFEGSNVDWNFRNGYQKLYYYRV